MCNKSSKICNAKISDRKYTESAEGPNYITQYPLCNKSSKICNAKINDRKYTESAEGPNYITHTYTLCVTIPPKYEMIKFAIKTYGICRGSQLYKKHILCVTIPAKYVMLRLTL